MIHIQGENTHSRLYTNPTPKEWKKWYAPEECIQPNAIDVMVESIYKTIPGEVVLVGDTKVHAKKELLKPVDGVYRLASGKYDVVFQSNIEIAEGEAGFLIQRSTLNRNGITVTSGLYDSGYDGIIGGALHIPEGTTLVIGEHERLAQLLMFEAEALTLYDGTYNSVKRHC